MKFFVIGITDNPEPWFPPEVLETIKQGKVFSGGKRHHEIVTRYLPENAQWIDITAPLDAVFAQYETLPRDESLIVFASGDPLFFGFANTIKRKMKEAEIVIYPTFNSLQMLAHRLVLPYHDMRTVSLTGRHWPEFDKALIERAHKIGILTDKEHTPAAIAQRMIDYGYTDYTMHVGEHLGNPQKEKVSTLSLDEAAKTDFSMPNCVILTGQSRGQAPEAEPSEPDPMTIRPWGIPESEFDLLDGREKMITKMPVRLLSLQALDLHSRKVFWDIGFCTGSVSIEARLLFPHLEIHAFEIRRECEAIIRENARRFGAPGINIHMGDFLSTPLHDSEGLGVGLSLPDAVFIGGHGGRLKEIMAKVLQYLRPGGCIVMNSVKAPKVLTDSHQLWDEACQELGLIQSTPTRIVLDENNPIEILRATL